MRVRCEKRKLYTIEEARTKSVLRLERGEKVETGNGGRGSRNKNVKAGERRESGDRGMEEKELRAGEKL